VLDALESMNAAPPTRYTARPLTVCLLVALMCYYLPWHYHPAAALSANAFDLAEWVGLSPAVRYAFSPPMVAPFLLRVVLSMLAVLFALNAPMNAGLWRWLNGGVALLLAITLAPPIEFIRVPGATADPNYRQLFALLIGTLIALGGVLLLARFRVRIPFRALSVLLAVLAMVAGAGGLALAMNVLSADPLRIEGRVGIGAVGLVGALVVYCLVQWGGSHLSARHVAKNT
jgi:hypothetical protein